MEEEKVGIKTGLMDVVIEEKDLEEFLPKAEEEEKREEVKRAIASLRVWEKEKCEIKEPHVEALRGLLLKAIAKKIKAIIPKGLALSRITFSGEVSGKPFGIGVSGTVEVVFERVKPWI